jgi:hypothetical protein
MWLKFILISITLTFVAGCASSVDQAWERDQRLASICRGAGLKPMTEPYFQCMEKHESQMPTQTPSRGSNIGGSSSNPQRVIEMALAEQDRCLMGAQKGNKRQCVNQLYSRINSGIPDSDPEKAPALNAVTKMYTLYTKYDRSEITSQQDMQNGLRQIGNELAMDLQRARYISAVQGEMESNRQRQLFQEAQRLLAPGQSPVRTCSPAMGSPPGTLVCR